MSDPKSSELEDSKPGVLFSNIMGLVGTYVVILLFCVHQVLEQANELSAEPSAEIWLKAIVDAVCISTFTYSATQTINNLIMDKKKKAIRLNCGVLVGDLTYILLYSLFGTKYIPLDVFMCIGTGFLVGLPSFAIYLMVRVEESGQESDHIMATVKAGQKDATPQRWQSPES